MSPRRRTPARSSVVFLTVLTAAVLASGCGSDNESAQDTTAGCATDSTSGRDDVNLISVPPAKVTVTGFGTGARRGVAATPDLNSPQRVSLTTTSSGASAQDRQSETVTTGLTARYHCTDLSDLEMTVGSVTSPDPMLVQSLPAMVDTRAGMAMAPGHVPISLRLIPPADASPQARLAVEQSLIGALTRSVPLPTEAIAVGATWRAQRIISGAATVTQTIDATLTAWQANRMTITFTADETPVNSVFAIPGSNETLQITRFSFTGKGTVTLDLTRGLPISGEATYSGARELVGADPTKPLLQQTGFAMQWQ